MKATSDNAVPTNGLMGVVCGDCAGLPYEFRGTRTKDYNFELSLNDFSDDTILTVAIARWLMSAGRSADELRRQLLSLAQRFIKKNVWGTGFIQWVESGGTIDRSGVRSNGAAMRVVPIGYASDDIGEVRRLADLSARMTHDSDEASRGAQAVAAAVLMARQGAPKAEIARYMADNFAYDMQRTVEDIRRDYKFEIFCDLCVPEAILCYVQSDTYEATIRNAVSLGGDADTQAAIAGGIAAATPGMDIPGDIALACWQLLPEDFKETILAFPHTHK